MSRRQVWSMCRQCQTRLQTSMCKRSFTTTTVNHLPAETDNTQTAIPRKASQSTSSSSPNSDTRTGRLQDSRTRQGQAQTAPPSPPPPAASPSTSQIQPPARRPKSFGSAVLNSLASAARGEASTRPGSGASEDEPYHLNVYAHKHNLHITFSEPSRNPILSFSSGDLGLRKAQRGTFDAAYQLSTYTMRKMAEKQWRPGGKNAAINRMLTISEPEVRRRGIEVVMRGYGPGREAFQKALLGTEGRVIKTLVKRVTDGTRLKFGGVRSRAVRRLG